MPTRVPLSHGPADPAAAAAASRWSAMVGCLRLVGASAAAAEQTAVEALARSWPVWATARPGPDADVRVAGELLRCWSRRARHEDPSSAAAPPGAAVTSGEEPAGELQRQLAGLDPVTRTVLVLRYVCDLGDDQVATVLDLPAWTVADRLDEGLALLDVDLLAAIAGPEHALDGPVHGAFRAAVEQQPPGDPPLARILSIAQRRRRRRRSLVAAGVAGTLVVAGASTWSGVRSDGHGATAALPLVRVEPNLAGLPWWADDQLHLARAVVSLPGVEQVLATPDGAVVSDREGAIRVVDDEGGSTAIGHTRAGEPVAASPDQGRAAWIDPRDGSPELVVYDLERDAVVAREDLLDLGTGPGTADRAVAVDGRSVYFTHAGRSWQWLLPTSDLGEPGGVGGPVDTGRDGLLDVAAGVEVRQVAPQRILIVQPFFSVDFRRAGIGAQLSPGGEYALTRAFRPPGSDALGQVRIYDTRNGDRVWTGLHPDEIAVAAVLGPADEATYVVARRVGQGWTGPSELRTCHLAERLCFRVAGFPLTAALPVLGG